MYCFPPFRVNCLSVLFVRVSRHKIPPHFCLIHVELLSRHKNAPHCTLPHRLSRSINDNTNLYLLRLDLVVPFVLVYLIIISLVIGKIPRFDFLEKKSHYSRLLSNLSFRKRDMISLLLISSSRGRLWLKHCKSWRRSHHRRCGRNRLATSGCG